MSITPNTVSVATMQSMAPVGKNVSTRSVEGMANGEGLLNMLSMAAVSDLRRASIVMVRNGKSVHRVDRTQTVVASMLKPLRHDVLRWAVVLGPVALRRR
jgi:hypothetical protein